MKVTKMANGPGNSRPTDPKSLLEQRLADLHAAVRHRQKDWADALAAASDLKGNLADVVRRERAARAALEQQLAERQAQYEIDIARAEAVRAMIDEQIQEAALAVERARHAEASAVALVSHLRQAEADAVARLAEREEQFATELSRERTLGAERLATYQHRIEQETAARRRAEETLASAHMVHADAEKRHESTLSDAAVALAERESELTAIAGRRDSLERQLRGVQARLTQESESRTALEQALTDLRSTAAATEQRLRDEIGTITENARGEQVQLEDQMSRERHNHEIQLTNEQQQHRSALAVATTRLAEREAQFRAELASIAGRRDGLERQLLDVEAKLTQETESRTSLEQALTDLCSTAAATEQRLRDEIDAITETARAEQARLEDQMSRLRHDYEIQLTNEQEQHRSALAVAATRLAQRETQFKTELASIAGRRDALERQLRDVDARLTQETESRTGLEQALADLRSTAAATEQRLRDEIDAITETARAEQVRLEDQMSRERHDHEIQLTNEQQQHRSALAVAATRLAEREAQFKTELASIAGSRDSLEHQLRDVEAKLTQETESRTSLERALTELRSAAAAAEQSFRRQVDAITENARAEQARLEDQMSRERHDHETQLTNEQEQHRSALAVAATRLADREAQFKTELASIAGSRDNLEQQLQDVEARLTEETECRTGLEQALADLRSTAAAAEQRFRDEIGTITENAATERARLEEQMSNQCAQSADRLAERRAEFEAELKRLAGDHANAAGQLRALIAERDSRLEERARASAALRHQLDASEAENRRQFEEAPVPLIRCTRAVGVAGVNRAFGTLVGWRAHSELRDQFVAALFESRDDLIWLVERSMSTGKTESVETSCIRKDGTRIAVRLSARACASGLVEIAAEDLTAVRVLEDRLREARRMESVGRLASEIAVTCEKLLNDVYRDAQRLLTTMTGDEAPQRSETLLDEVTRVGSFLHQLVAYGHEQTAALAPVDLNRVLRHLEPVLRQVAGDSVTLELRKASSPVNVDVNAERVERLLVNVASYGRERMPSGGRLQIELSTVVVDGRFIAQHPNVRQGPHALITVTEAPRSIAECSVSDRVSKPDARGVSERPGVDLSALQELISECGGHLWITAEPGGSMVVKMRLPLRAPWEGQAERARHGLGRVTARLLGR